MQFADTGFSYSRNHRGMQGDCQIHCERRVHIAGQREILLILNGRRARVKAIAELAKCFGAFSMPHLSSVSSCAWR
jgi:hypothetical protein